MSEITIAQIQFQPALGDIISNTKEVAKLIDKCKNCNLIILPELSDIAYNFPDKNYALKHSQEFEENIFVKMLREKSTEYELSIISGFAEKHTDKLFNSSILIHKGEILGIYRKIHLFMNEKDIFLPGKGNIEVYNLGDFKIGMLICFDYLFPEVWRILAEKGADIIAHPSNLVTYNAFKVIPALSVMNKVFIATTNRIGSDNGLSFAGRSFLCKPEGEIISEASSSETEILISKIDASNARNKFITERNHVFKDRRPEEYNL